MDQILQDIYRRKPDVIGFSCYIWNIQYIRPFLKDIPKKSSFETDGAGEKH